MRNPMAPGTTTLPPSQTAISTVALALVYFLLAIFSFAVSRSEEGVALLWLPNSIAIAWLFHRARYSLSQHVAAILTANIVANLAFSSTFLYAVGSSLANLIEIMIMLQLVRNMNVITDQLSVKDSLKILSTLGLVAAPLTVVTGATLAWLEDDVSWRQAVINWWLGDVIGACLLLLPALSFTRSARAKLFQAREMFTLLIIVGVLLVIALTVITYMPFPLVYLVMPLMVVAIMKGMLSSAVAANIVYLLLSAGVFWGWWDWSMFHEMDDLRGVWTACAAVVFAPVMMGIAIDEIKQRQAELIRLTERMSLASENIALGLWDWDLKRQSIYWDKRMRMLYSMKPDSDPLRVDQWRLRVHPDDLELAEDALVDSLEGKSDYNVMYRISNPEGGYRALHASGIVIRDASGEPTRMVGMNWDVTELVSAQSAMRSAEAKLNSVVESASEFSIIATTTEGLIEVFSAGAELLLGYSKHEMVQRKTPVIFHDEDELVEVGKQLSLQHGKVVAGFDVLIFNARNGLLESREWTYIRKDGSRVPINLTVTPIRENAAIVGYLGIARNITQQKKNEFEIKAAHNVLEQQIRMAQQMRDEFESLFELAPGAMLVLDDMGIVIKANSRAHEQFGYSDTLMLGKGITTFIPDVQESELIVKKYHQALVSNNAGNAVLHGVRSDENQFLASVEFSPLLINGVLHTIVNVHDITRQKEVEQELELSRDLAESANRAKTGFLANMSHEIRTPLNAVLGAAQLLDYTSLDRQQYKYVGMITAAGQALLAVLNDVLDVSKIEAGKMELAHTPFELGDILEPLATIMSANAAKKELELVIAIDPQVPRHFIGDSVRIQQVLVNLTGNAIKFTQAGEVVVEINQCNRTERHIELELRVRDTGIGMSDEQKARLFSAFSQGDSSITRRFGGTGLGLTICQKLIEMMGGTIEMHSSEETGTEFVCTMQLEYVVPGTNQAGAKRDVFGQQQLERDQRQDASLRVMLVDGNYSSQNSIKRYFEHWCWQVEVVSDLNEAEAGLADQRRDAIDVLVFNQNVRGVDALDRFADKMPCVKLITTLAKEDFIHQQMNSGKLILLSKPVTASGLFEGITEARSRFNSDALPRAVYVEEQLRPKLSGARILLVEDNPLNQTIALGVLDQTDAKVDVVNNGEEAVQKIQAVKKPFDLVLMDVQMPVMDGFTATRIIREQLQLEIPIIAMTAGVLAFERQQCIESGMNDFIGKPINVDSMILTIAKYLPNQAKFYQPNYLELEQEAGREEPLPVEQEGKENAVDNDEDIFDPENILKFVRGKPAREREVLAMIARIVDDGLKPLEDGRRLLAEGEADEASRYFHTLKGAIGNFGAKGVFRTAQELEEVIKARKSEQYDAKLDEFGAALKAMLSAASDWLKTYPASELIDSEE
ncbi:MAG: PAS domain S-box protein [Ketobacter sp.]|nr:MAG: PAS domain S-box protein [Ketobacter sp.]